MKKELAMVIQGALAVVGAFLSAKLGVLYPVLCVLGVVMAVDYITGMMACKVEAIDHPNDKNYGWSSKKGAIGIMKKVAYLCIIVVGMVVDFVIVSIAELIGFEVPMKAIFGLLVAAWYLLNELLSIIENVGRMGVNVPEWLRQYIAVLRDKIDNKAE